MSLFSFSSTPKKVLAWKQLTTIDELSALLQTDKPQLFFKHSTRCSISSMALSRFEQQWSSENELCELNFIDLLNYREVSNELADQSGVMHQSPQVILIKNGKVIYDASHSAINAFEIESILK
jgi:bacillithiol system protein YtxJ